MSLLLLDSAICGTTGKEEAKTRRVTTINKNITVYEKEESSSGNYLTNFLENKFWGNSQSTE